MRIPRDVADAECCTRAASNRERAWWWSPSDAGTRGRRRLSSRANTIHTNEGALAPIPPSARRNALAFLCRRHLSPTSALAPDKSLLPRRPGLDAMTAPVIDYAGSLYLGS
jgi:hypothetical protein